MSEHDAHVPSVKIYLYVFLGLLAGTALTVLVAKHDFGPLNNVFAMVIAGTKAIVVALFFMHLRHSTRMTILTALAGLFWLFLMIGMFMMDYVSRVSTMLPVPGK